MKDFAIKLAKRTGELLLKKFHSLNRDKVRYKGKGRELVTAADLKANKLIVREIRKEYPDHDILSEEADFIDAAGKDYLWIIDPLDGTSNFVAGSALWGINIALARRGKIILGVMYMPLTDELYIAEKGRKPLANNRPIRVSQESTLKNSMILFCHGYDIDDIRHGSSIYTSIHPQSLSCRVWGAAGVEFAAVARGGAEAFIVSGAQPWDVSAGVLLVRQAGGQVTDASGKDWKFGMKPAKQILVASNGKVHDRLLKIIKNI